MQIERLSDHHDRTAFDCGNAPLNDFLQRQAGQFARKEIGVTHVLVEHADSPVILGYVMMTMRTILPEDAGLNKISSHPQAVALIGQLAVAENRQGEGLGTRLLNFALYLTEAASQSFGILGAVLDLVAEKKRGYYTRHGFTALQSNPSRLFISIKQIRQKGFAVKPSPNVMNPEG